MHGIIKAKLTKFDPDEPRDEHGKWTTVFHGRLDRGTPKAGDHFGTITAAQSRIDNLREESGTNRRAYMHEVKLRLGKTIELTDPVEDWYLGDMAKELKAKGVLSDTEFNQLQKKNFNFDYAKLLTDKGYDTIKYTNKVEDPGSVSYVPLRQNNILADKILKFDPNEPRDQAGKWTTVYHGTRAAHDLLEPDAVNTHEDGPLDRMLGTHVAKDPNIANSFTLEAYGLGQPAEGSRIFELKLDESKYLTVPQPTYSSGALATDQYQIDKMIMGVAYRKDPAMLARYLTAARAQPADKAVSLAHDLVAGKTVRMEGRTYTLDSFIDDFTGAHPYDPDDRQQAVKLARDEWEKQGYQGLKYINTAPMETDYNPTGKVADKTSFVVFDKKYLKPYFAKFDPSEARDAHGRWTAGGGGDVFVSPNVKSLDLAGAEAALNSDRQRYLTKAFRVVDRELGIRSQSKPVLGTWRDGAENSVISHSTGASWDQLALSGAMKGWLANQKQVLVFQEQANPTDAEGKPSHAFLATFHAKGQSVADVQRYMVDHGLEFGTYEPVKGGTNVYIYGDNRRVIPLVKAAGAHYGAEVTAHIGRGEFIGSQKEDGTDAEQRADARKVYSGIIGGSRVPGAAAGWARVRNRFRRPDTVTKAVEPETYHIHLRGQDASRKALKALGEAFPNTPWTYARGQKAVVIEGPDAYARIMKVLAPLAKDFNPDEPRDEKGEWTAVYHGTLATGFDRFQVPDPRKEIAIDRAIGIHVAKDPKVADVYTHDIDFLTGKPQASSRGSIYELEVPSDHRFLTVDQGNKDGPAAITDLVYNTAFKADPVSFAHWLSNNPRYAYYPITGSDKASQDARVHAVNLFHQEMAKRGYIGLKYNVDQASMREGAKDSTAYVVFDPANLRTRFGHKTVKFNPNHDPHSGEFTSGAGEGDIKAFHGSPYQFTQFDESAEGSAHGNANFGHGFYVTDSPNVANFYSSRDDTETSSGYLYDVAIHAKPEDFLDWDKPLADQPKMVARLQQVVSQPPYDGGEKNDLSVFSGLYQLGGDAKDPNYNASLLRTALQPQHLTEATGGMVMNILGHNALASHALLKAGIEGVRYADQTVTNNAHDYVIFDPKKIDILGSHESSVKKSALKGGFLAFFKFDPNEARDEKGEWTAGGGGIKAYHGSPHDFSQFNELNIGSGQGAQTYGYGLYFAEAPDVARKYQQELAPSNILNANYVFKNPVTGKDVQANSLGLQTTVKNIYNDPAAGAFADRFVGQHSIDPTANRDALIARAQAQMKSVAGFDPIKPELARDIASRITLPSSGHMYEVRIDAKPEDFLDWDKPLDQQSPKVKAAINKVLDADRYENSADTWRQHFASVMDSGGTSRYVRGTELKDGAELLNFLEDGYTNDTRKRASELLRNAGIKGIRYLDQGSRSNKPPDDLGADAKAIADHKAEWDGLVAELHAANARASDGQGDKDYKIGQKLDDLNDKMITETYNRQRTHNYVVFDPKLVHIVAKDDQINKFDPSEPRDEKGEWTVGSAGPPPATDKPVVLTFHGSFNPPSEGHRHAVTTALKYLKAKGYNVEHVIVAPNSDGYLNHKLGAKAYPVADRVAMSKLAFADIPNVEIKPSDAQTYQQHFVQDSVAKDYPNHTVIEIEGQDREPGKHPPYGLSVFSGDPGTDHAGYNYVNIPRPKGAISSTAIRDAIHVGKPVPKKMIRPEVYAYVRNMLRSNPQIEKYDPNEARDERGRWTGGSYHFDSEISEAGTDFADAPKLKEAIWSIADREHFPRDLIEFHGYIVNEPKVMAETNRDTNRIRVYLATIDDPELAKGIMAHEIQHAKFNDYLKVHPELEDQLRPGADNATVTAFRTSDGITKYSHLVWEHAGYSRPLQAVHETLAEIANVKQLASVGRKPIAHSRYDKAPSPAYMDLYKKVNAYWDSEHRISKFDPDEPRDDHGKWTSGGAHQAWSPGGFTQPPPKSEEFRASIRDAVNEIATQNHYPLDRITFAPYSTRPEDDPRVAGGTVMGVEDPEDGRLYIYTDTLDGPDHAKGIAAHEIMHGKIEAWMFANQNGPDNWRYQLASKGKALATGDGLTNYSKHVWMDWLRGGMREAPLTPIHETLAEMARLQQKYGAPDAFHRFRDGLHSKEWSALYKQINDSWDQNRDAYFEHFKAASPKLYAPFPHK